MNEKKRITWDEYYSLAEAYYKYYGYLEMYYNFKTTDGVNHNESGVKLGKWLNIQRNLYINGNLSKDKIDKLSLIGFNLELDSLEVDFQKYYLLLKKYIEFHKNNFVKENFRTINGYEYNELGLPLGTWLMSQKQKYKKGMLNGLKIRKLLELGINLDKSASLAKWDSMYSLALAYYTKYKNIDVPKKFYTIDGINYDQTGQNLGLWLMNQRVKFFYGKLTEEQINKLLALDYSFDINSYEAKWQEMYLLASAFYNYHHHLNISKTFKTSNGYDYDPDGKNLGHWFITQKSANKNDDLSSERKSLLLAIGMDFEYNSPKTEWYRMYSMLNDYYINNGDLKSLLKNTLSDEKNKELRRWFNDQIERYLTGSLKQEYILEFKKIGIDLDDYIEDNDWDLMYTYFVNYIKHYKTNIVPQDFITNDGINISDNGVNLSEWIETEKVRFGCGILSQDHQEKLESLGVVFFVSNNFNDTWNEWFKLALNFYKHYGHLEVKKSFKTLNGYDFDSKGKRLGLWISSQRKNYNSGILKSDRITRLESIGMIFEKKIRDNTWLDYYNLLEKYYSIYHHINIPDSFKTNNGYEYDENGLELGNWLKEQKKLLYKESLSYHYKYKLNSIGLRVVKNDIDEKWLMMYEKAKSFYLENGHLNISSSFIKKLQTNDYDNLLRWLIAQRSSYKNNKLSIDKIDSLNNIRMIWDIRSNISSIKMFCVEKNILYTKYSKQFENTPYIELEAKYNYLIDNFLPVVVEDKLNEIFFMGDKELQDKYSISLAELIKLYQVSDKSKVKVF